MSLAFRAGILERDFWGMTAHNIYSAFNASQENLSRLAYRTAYFHRVQHKHFPKNEDAIFRKAKPQRQTIKEQFVMAKFMTKVMSKEVH